MTIPDFQSIMRPVLECLEARGPQATRDLKAWAPDHFGLSAEERDAPLSSGKQRVIDNRVAWAVSHLAQAGLIARPKRGVAEITAAGREMLGTHAGRIAMKDLMAFPSYVAFRTRTSSAASPEPEEASSDGTSPLERMQQAELENRAMVEADLLQRALAMTPRDFELLVVDLLRKMGYGRTGEIIHSGQPGDGGIDGIISQDPLGLDRIYVQAKRYAPEHPVSRPELQKFVGALMGAQGDRGVFMTTTVFTKGATDEALKVQARIELVDGPRLAALMVEHGVGVQVEHVATVHRVDAEYFDGG